MPEINLYRSNTRQTLFVWREGLHIGHEPIDRQHQDIYEALLGVSLLLKMPDVNVGYWLGMVSRKVEEYVQTHFQEEERLMAVVGYPDLLAHRRTHQHFVETFQQHKDRIARLTTAEEKLAEAHGLMDLLNGWFDTEVLLHDRDLVDFINNRKT
ncbi:MAG: hypothetical protein H7838_12410 [Magnetococcus sp. DMHC-8]